MTLFHVTAICCYLSPLKYLVLSAVLLGFGHLVQILIR
jgi:hypothetical protein